MAKPEQGGQFELSDDEIHALLEGEDAVGAGLAVLFMLKELGPLDYSGCKEEFTRDDDRTLRDLNLGINCLAETGLIMPNEHQELILTERGSDIAIRFLEKLQPS